MCINHRPTSSPLQVSFLSLCHSRSRCRAVAVSLTLLWSTRLPFQGRSHRPFTQPGRDLRPSSGKFKAVWLEGRFVTVRGDPLPFFDALRALVLPSFSHSRHTSICRKQPSKRRPGPPLSSRFEPLSLRRQLAGRPRAIASGKAEFELGDESQLTLPNTPGHSSECGR